MLSAAIPGLCVIGYQKGSPHKEKNTYLHMQDFLVIASVEILIVDVLDKLCIICLHHSNFIILPRWVVIVLFFPLDRILYPRVL